MSDPSRRDFLRIVKSGAFLLSANSWQGCAETERTPKPMAPANNKVPRMTTLTKTSTARDTKMNWIQDALEYSIQVTRQNLTRVTDFPELTKNGRWEYAQNKPGGWVGGHWTGLLWLAFAHTSDKSLEHAARDWTAKLAPRQNDTGTHDLGFVFELSHVLGAQLTGDASLRAPALQAARSLIQRYNDQGKFIRAWGALGSDTNRGRGIIDTMMNLDLLFWAARETGDSRFAEIAAAHARTALRYNVRPDWSTSHVMDFDPATGAFLKRDTHQGLSATSCWARGQAWALYGFAETYRNTNDAAFLDASRHFADYSLRRSPTDHVPYWDYDSPLIPQDVHDSSAGSALASGLLLLSSLEADAAGAERWRREATTILESLWQNYSSRGTSEPSILIHGTRSKPHGYMDSGLIYGDYYFVEALTRLVAPEKVLV
jgi:unsaturated chondroitin disaccharide hydrolase